MIKHSIIFLLSIFMLVSYGLGLQQFDADKAHSSISFQIRHMVVSKVNGHFNDFSVTIMADTVDFTKSTVTATVKVATIDTGNEKRDIHLKSADFFEVEKYPEATYKSNSVEKKGDEYIAHGTLTMHGVSKSLDINFKILGQIKDFEGKTRVGIEATAVLDRKDYNISWNRALDTGGVILGSEVTLEILLEMVGK